jgi:hypothetical protein
MKTPKIAAGKTISSSGFIAPEYGRKLQSGNYKETHTICLK